MNHWNVHPLLPAEQVFLVGGAVRDIVLGLPARDLDYVVVGMEPQELADLGFVQVGKDFPVFLCPQTKEEYALARVERKTGVGYNGFTTQTSGVSLEEDLRRRDLTINAMAMNWKGDIIDPFGGLADIANKQLRHVSEAFSEDPLRVLRVARFAARYAEDGFVVAPDTMDLMKSIVEQGEVDHLVPERIWLEFGKVAKTNTPSKFLRALHDCGALKRLLPEVDALYGVPQVALHHPEIDTGVHTEMVMDQAAKIAPGNSSVLFAALTHDLGKAITPSAEWPKHHNHETLGLDPLAEVVKRWKLPTDASSLAKVVCAYHLDCHRSLESKTGTVLKLLDTKLDAFRQPKRFAEFLLSCEADKRGRLGLEHGDYPQAELLKKCYEAAKSVSGKPYVEQGLTGLEIKEQISRERLRRIKSAQTAFKREQKESTSSEPENVKPKM